MMVTTFIGMLLAAARPQIKAGYDCSKPCSASTKASGRRACAVSDFRWDLLDALQHHMGLRAQGNGSVIWDTSHNTPGYSCNPFESTNQSMFMQHARDQDVKNILALHAPTTRIPSYNSSSEVFQLLANSSRRYNAAASACSVAHQSGFDGISVDFEGPWNANVAFRQVFADFVKELATACNGFAPALTVCSALAHDLAYSAGEDANAQAKFATDGIILMTYDYLFVTSKGKNSLSRPNAPLYSDAYMGAPSSNNNVNSSVWYAMQQLQVPPEKLTIGIAWYGKEVPVSGPNMGTKINVSQASSSTTHGRQQTSYNYQQPLAEERAATVGGGRKWDNVSKTPWYSYSDPQRPWLFWQGFYDDAESLRYKYDMVNNLGLRGVLIWNLNGCTLGAAPSMWQTLEEAFGIRV